MGAIPIDTVISSRYGGVFYAQYKDNIKLFQSNKGVRFTGSGLRCVFKRLYERTGIHVTPHAMRRTFTILSLRASMRLLHLQTLGGWDDPEMIEKYAQMVDDDLLREHKAHSPVDNL